MRYLKSSVIIALWRGGRAGGRRVGGCAPLPMLPHAGLPAPEEDRPEPQPEKPLEVGPLELQLVPKLELGPEPEP